MHTDRPVNGEFKGNNANYGGGNGNQNNSHARNIYANDNSRARVQEHHNAPHPDKNQDRGGREQREEKDRH